MSTFACLLCTVSLCLLLVCSILLLRLCILTIACLASVHTHAHALTSCACVFQESWCLALTLLLPAYFLHGTYAPQARRVRPDRAPAQVPLLCIYCALLCCVVSVCLLLLFIDCCCVIVLFFVVCCCVCHRCVCLCMYPCVVCASLLLAHVHMRESIIVSTGRGSLLFISFIALVFLK